MIKENAAPKNLVVTQPPVHSFPKRVRQNKEDFKVIFNQTGQDGNSTEITFFGYDFDRYGKTLPCDYRKFFVNGVVLDHHIRTNPINPKLTVVSFTVKANGSGVIYPVVIRLIQGRNVFSKSAHWNISTITEFDILNVSNRHYPLEAYVDLVQDTFKRYFVERGFSEEVSSRRSFAFAKKLYENRSLGNCLIDMSLAIMRQARTKEPEAFEASLSASYFYIMTCLLPLEEKGTEKESLIPDLNYWVDQPTPSELNSLEISFNLAYAEMQKYYPGYF